MKNFIVWIICGVLCPSVFAVNAPEDPGRNRKFKFSFNGEDREYRVHLPPGDIKLKTYPLVINLHEGGGDAESADAVSHLAALADREEFILVAPQGSGKRLPGHTAGTWNAGRCCGSAVERNVDDVKFISTVIDKLAKDFTIDRKRIFVTGISNGGMMAYRLACELSDKIAAIAPVAAIGVVGRCEPTSTVATIQFSGTDDPCVPYHGGSGGGCLERVVGRRAHHPIPEVRLPSETVPKFFDQWREKNQLSGSGHEFFRHGNAVCVSYGPNEKNSEVTLCTIAGGGHTWPGGDYGKMCETPDSEICAGYRRAVGSISRDLDASSIMWEFFKRHPKN